LNKKFVAGVIAAIIIAIAITSIVYYVDITPKSEDTETKIINESITTGKKFTLELTEKVGISEKP